MTFGIEQALAAANSRITLEDGSILSCLDTVRRIPGRRIVCRGRWNELDVYAKIFLGNKAARYADRDRRGVEALTAVGIQTPALLYAGKIAGSAEVLIFSAINDGVNADQAWSNLALHSKERRSLAEALVVEVARHHKAGLLQIDLYFKNFLLQGKFIYTLDGDAIRPLPWWNATNSALNNLALLLSKLDVLDLQEWLPDLLAAYARERGSSTPDTAAMRKKIAAIRSRVTAKYADKKVFRECSEISVLCNKRLYRAVSRANATETMDGILANADALLQENSSRKLKSGNTCTVALTEINGRKMVIKRYNIKGFWHGVSRALRRSRAAISWANAFRLHVYDIATPAPVALVERRYGFIRRQAYLVTDYVDAPDIDAYFADSTIDPARKSAVAQQLAHLLYKLKLLGIAHGDFKATNVKVLEDQPLLIDLDSMREYRCRRLFERRHVRDLRRLLQNWRHDVETRGLLRQALKETYKDQQPLQQAGWL